MKAQSFTRRVSLARHWHHNCKFNDDPTSVGRAPALLAQNVV
jgi:hypothetical protein